MIKIFEGELGKEKHLIDIDYPYARPVKGELIAFEKDDSYDVWEVINILHDYGTKETDLFVKRYIWPDER